ncbi:unnamed protein product [Auanema sp. JU1783]|nr:unnamed protein product [Auanema sp. JU1783]
MWNESFSGADAGWGGDASFATQAPKDSEMRKVSDRLPIPVTIQDLRGFTPNDEKYTLGDYGFGTALIIGRVERLETGNEHSISYDLIDIEDEQTCFKVVMYTGLNDSRKDLQSFVEGTRMMALGKLRSLSDEFSLIAYDIKEITDDKEYEAYLLEAKLAKLFFAKNVPNKLALREILLEGTCIGVPANAAQRAIGQNSHTKAEPNRLYPNANQQQNDSDKNSIAAANGLQGQKASIVRLLEAEQGSYGEHGFTVEEIRQKLRAPNVDSIRADLEFLATEGHVYTTISDDHFALIT